MIRKAADLKEALQQQGGHVTKFRGRGPGEARATYYGAGAAFGRPVSMVAFNALQKRGELACIKDTYHCKDYGLKDSRVVAEAKVAMAKGLFDVASQKYYEAALAKGQAYNVYLLAKAELSKLEPVQPREVLQPYMPKDPK